MAAGELITDLLIFERKVKYLTQRLILYLQIDFMFDGNFLTVDKRISGWILNPFDEFFQCGVS